MNSYEANDGAQEGKKNSSYYLIETVSSIDIVMVSEGADADDYLYANTAKQCPFVHMLVVYT